MKKLLLILALTAAIVIGCTVTQQKTAYNSIYTVEQGVTTTYNGYLDLVIQGQVPTNDVPKVSAYYNKIQASITVALDGVQYNTNALAPSSLIVESQDFVNLITTIKGKK